MADAAACDATMGALPDDDHRASNDEAESQGAATIWLRLISQHS